MQRTEIFAQTDLNLVAFYYIKVFIYFTLFYQYRRIVKKIAKYNKKYIVKHLSKNRGITDEISIIRNKFSCNEVLNEIVNIAEPQLNTLYLSNDYNVNFQYNMTYLIKLFMNNVNSETNNLIVRLMAKMTLENIGYLQKYPKFKKTFIGELRKTNYTWIDNYINLINLFT